MQTNQIFNQINNVPVNHIFNQFNNTTNPTLNEVNNNYIPNKKQYPDNFDMLFDASLLAQGPSSLNGNSKSTEDKNESVNKKSLQDHNFDFVSAMMKPKK